MVYTHTDESKAIICVCDDKTKTAENTIAKLATDTLSRVLLPI